MGLSHLFGIIGSTLVAIIVVPQAFRIRRRGIAGVSVATYQLMLSINVMWLSYFWVKHHYDGLPGLTIATFVTGYVLFLCTKRLGVLRCTQVALIVFAVSLVIWAMAGVAAMGWFIAILNGVIPIPQLMDAIRSDDIEGVSATTWTLATLTNVIWLSYGITVSDRIVISTNAWCGAVSAAVVAASEVRRHRVSRQLP